MATDKIAKIYQNRRHRVKNCMVPMQGLNENEELKVFFNDFADKSGGKFCLVI
jgi:hypothetical protein